MAAPVVRDISRYISVVRDIYLSGYIPDHRFIYGTDLMQRRTRTRVVGYHSPCTRTTSSVSFNGLELGLERKLERALLQTENISKGA